MGSGCLLVTLLIFNVIFFLLGLGLAVIGGLVVSAGYIDDLQDAYPSADIGIDITALGGAVLVVGVLMVVVQVVGCCGACLRRKGILYAYAVFTSIFVVGQVIFAGLAFSYRAQVTDDDSSELHAAVLETLERTNMSQPIMATWNRLQESLECCGVSGSQDWAERPGTPFTGREVLPLYPDSCCESFSDGCASKSPPAEPYKKGCFQAIHDQVDSYGMTIGVGDIVFALAQVLGIVVACRLARNSEEF